jgi:multidrug efflux pump
MVNKLLAKARESSADRQSGQRPALNKPQLSVDIDRDKASRVRRRRRDDRPHLETLLGGRQVTRFKREGKQYDVMVQLEAKDRRPADRPDRDLRARARRPLVQLSEPGACARDGRGEGAEPFQPPCAPRSSRRTSPRLHARRGARLHGPAARKCSARQRAPISTALARVPRGRRGLLCRFPLALAFIYLVLAAQFESFVSPFIIMLTVPLARSGAACARAHRRHAERLRQVGLVMLIGLITKHGILIVEFANQLRERGMERAEAVVEAATLRLRPILMTTGAMVLGAVPLALATGAGAEARQQIGWVIVGGLTVGTLFTLYIIPTAYTLLARQYGLAKPSGGPVPAKAPSAREE